MSSLYLCPQRLRLPRFKGICFSATQIRSKSHLLILRIRQTSICCAAARAPRRDGGRVCGARRHRRRSAIGRSPSVRLRPPGRRRSATGVSLASAALTRGKGSTAGVPLDSTPLLNRKDAIGRRHRPSVDRRSGYARPPPSLFDQVMRLVING